MLETPPPSEGPGRAPSPGGGRFDPRSDDFLTEFAPRSSVQPLNRRVLTAYQRALLVLDGTVTDFIEAWTMDPVRVLCLGQTERRLDADHVGLAASAGTEVLARSVILEGRHSGRFHAHAVSLIVVGRLPPALRTLLETGGAGLGQVLGANALETRREILWSGREWIPDPPVEVRARWAGEFIVRTYRIHSSGRPIMLISERFPFAKAEQPLFE